MFMIPGYQPATGATLPVVAAGRLYVRNDDQLFCYHVGSDALNQPRAESKQIVLDIPSPQVADKRQDQRRSVFVPTPTDVVEKMLQLADVQETDVVYDLGSGVGRIVITAAKDFGCKAVGYEIDSGLVESSRNRAKEAMVESKVSIVNKDLFTVDLRDADVIAVYLLPKQLEALMPQFEGVRSA
jgi:SAM-dependent methyltransferase